MQLVEARNAKAHSVASSSCLELRLAFGGVILDKLRADPFGLPPRAPCRWPTRCATLDATRSAAVEAALGTAWCHSVWTGTGQLGRSQGLSASMMYIARQLADAATSASNAAGGLASTFLRGNVAWFFRFAASCLPCRRDFVNTHHELYWMKSRKNLFSHGSVLFRKL